MVRDAIRRHALLLAVVVLAVCLCSAAAQNREVSEKEALPIVQRCFQCHGDTLQMSGLDLRTREGMLKGGVSGPAVVPGNAAGSLLYRRVTGAEPPRMPMAPVAPLTHKKSASSRIGSTKARNGSPLRQPRRRLQPADTKSPLSRLRIASGGPSSCRCVCRCRPRLISAGAAIRLTASSARQW
jgi:hypothetical protein